jgi:hypothetical protein
MRVTVRESMRKLSLRLFSFAHQKTPTPLLILSQLPCTSQICFHVSFDALWNSYRHWIQEEQSALGAKHPSIHVSSSSYDMHLSGAQLRFWHTNCCCNMRCVPEAPAPPASPDTSDADIVSTVFGRSSARGPGRQCWSWGAKKTSLGANAKAPATSWQRSAPPHSLHLLLTPRRPGATTLCPGGSGGPSEPLFESLRARGGPQSPAHRGQTGRRRGGLAVVDDDSSGEGHRPALRPSKTPPGLSQRALGAAMTTAHRDSGPATCSASFSGSPHPSMLRPPARSAPEAALRLRPSQCQSGRANVTEKLASPRARGPDLAH